MYPEQYYMMFVNDVNGIRWCFSPGIPIRLPLKLTRHYHEIFLKLTLNTHNQTIRTTQVEQELLTLPEHLSSPPVFSGVRVTRSLVLCVCFVDRCLSFCLFSFGHCVVCSSSIYRFWLPLWYLQTLLNYLRNQALNVFLFALKNLLRARVAFFFSTSFCNKIIYIPTLS
jgi:hypothetical protein